MSASVRSINSACLKQGAHRNSSYVCVDNFDEEKLVQYDLRSVVLRTS